MKALIRKDMIALWKYCRTYVILFLIFPAAGVFSEEFEFMEFYSVVLGGMLISTLIAYDERDKWDKLSLTLPLTRKQFVTAKYLTSAVIQLSTLSLTALLLALMQLLSGGVSWKDYFMELSVLLLLAVLVPSLHLPFIFKLGSEKGRIASIVTLLLMSVLIGVFGTFFVLLWGGKIPDYLTYLLIPVCILIPFASWRLAVHWFEKREF